VPCQERWGRDYAGVDPSKPTYHHRRDFVRAYFLALKIKHSPRGYVTILAPQYFYENFRVILAITCNPTTEKMNPRLRTRTTTGSTLNPGLSSVYNFSIVPDEPPAPAERVELGRAFRNDSLWSAAARRRRAVRGPPGWVGEEGRPTEDPETPEAAGPELGDLFSGPDSALEARGEGARGDAIKTEIKWKRQGY